MDRKIFRRSGFLNSLYRGAARVDCEHIRTAPRRFDTQITQAASQIEHMAMHERQGDFLERIQRKVAAGDLLLKLGVEKSDALTRVHLGAVTEYALIQFNLAIGRQAMLPQRQTSNNEVWRIAIIAEVI